MMPDLVGAKQRALRLLGYADGSRVARELRDTTSALGAGRSSTHRALARTLGSDNDSAQEQGRLAAEPDMSCHGCLFLHFATIVGR